MQNAQIRDTQRHRVLQIGGTGQSTWLVEPCVLGSQNMNNGLLTRSIYLSGRINLFKNTLLIWKKGNLRVSYLETEMIYAESGGP